MFGGGSIKKYMNIYKDRVIFHCDLNNFFASVECLATPELWGRPVAVCGNTQERHGIVLAKNMEAKRAGVRTGVAVWEAKAACPNLIIIPPHYDEYVTYSKYVREIYSRYTDRIESMGIDECWLDLTGSIAWSDGEAIANEIRTAVKEETGLTISVGVSFNKVFAKLGSDMKKPDAVTVIGEDDFREKIWSLPAGDLLGVGTRAATALLRRGIATIGDLARSDPEYLALLFGKGGRQMWAYANGYDTSEVLLSSDSPPIKSIGHGITTTRDLTTSEEVKDVIIELSQIVGEKLRREELAARAVAVSVRTCELKVKEYQGTLAHPTQLTRDIIESAYKIFCEKHRWGKPLRSVYVRAINLIPAEVANAQLSFLDAERSRLMRLERAVDEIRLRFGSHAVHSASYLSDIKISKRKKLADTPVFMYM